jgi:hypothetical protein
MALSEAIMPVREIFQQALAEFWRTVTEYPKALVLFLRKPRTFVARLEFDSWRAIKDAVGALLIGGALALVTHKINVAFYDERIQRVIQIQDKKINTIYLVVSVLAFVAFAYVPFRISSRHTTPLSIGIPMMYAIGYAAPVATLLVVVVTRLTSDLVGASIVVIPPLKIVQLSYPERTTFATVVNTAFGAIMIAWNLYLFWLFWFALSAANRVSLVRGAISLIVAVALLYALGGWIGHLTDLVLEPWRPYLEWIP